MGFEEPFAALRNSIQVATCRGCNRRLDFKRPPGEAATWTQATEAPPLLMIEISRQVADAAQGGEVVLRSGVVHSLPVPMGAGSRPVELHYQLVAAVMYKPGHYATCLLDEESDRWLCFDGMLQGEGGEGPKGCGVVIPPPERAQSLGGVFWSVLLYARVAA